MCMLCFVITVFFLTFHVHGPGHRQFTNSSQGPDRPTQYPANKTIFKCAKGFVHSLSSTSKSLPMFFTITAVYAFVFFCFWGYFFVPYRKPYPGKALTLQEQRYPFLSACVGFSCVRTMVRLPSVWDFSHAHRCRCMQLHTWASMGLTP